MGCISSTEDKSQRQVSEAINRQLREEKNNERREIKMLLLGTGESGKSTVLKQIRIIHGGGYTQEERLSTRDVIYSNVLQSMKIIVDAKRLLGIPLGSDASLAACTYIVEQTSQVQSLGPETVAAIRQLWGDAGIQACFARSREFQLNDSAKYYFDAIDRISAPDYVPTLEDILHSRIKTTGIVESTFNVEGHNYRIFDVGGQRSERKKWIHCFEHVTALFFIVALSEYDQRLIEDESANRMNEALQLFESIVHNQWFEKTSVILFLNKIDLFNAKVHVSPIEQCFEDFHPDPQTPLEEEGYNYFKQSFEKVFYNKSGKMGNRELFVFPTCATDTNGMRNIISSVNQIIVKANLENCGLL